MAGGGVELATLRRALALLTRSTTTTTPAVVQPVFRASRQRAWHWLLPVYDGGGGGDDDERVRAASSLLADARLGVVERVHMSRARAHFLAVRFDDNALLSLVDACTLALSSLSLSLSSLSLSSSSSSTASSSSSTASADRQRCTVFGSPTFDVRVRAAVFSRTLHALPLASALHGDSPPAVLPGALLHAPHDTVDARAFVATSSSSSTSSLSSSTHPLRRVLVGRCAGLTSPQAWTQLNERARRASVISDDAASSLLAAERVHWARGAHVDAAQASTAAAAAAATAAVAADDTAAVAAADDDRHRITRERVGHFGLGRRGARRAPRVTVLDASVAASADHVPTCAALHFYLASLTPATDAPSLGVLSANACVLRGATLAHVLYAVRRAHNVHARLVAADVVDAVDDVDASVSAFAHATPYALCEYERALLVDVLALSTLAVDHARTTLQPHVFVRATLAVAQRYHAYVESLVAATRASSLTAALSRRVARVLVDALRCCALDVRVDDE